MVKFDFVATISGFVEVEDSEISSLRDAEIYIEEEFNNCNFLNYAEDSDCDINVVASSLLGTTNFEDLLSDLSELDRKNLYLKLKEEYHNE